MKMKICYCLQFTVYGLRLAGSRVKFGQVLFVAGLAEEVEHVLLVGFNAGLVEGVDIKEETGDAAAFFEEVDELTEVVLVDAWHDDAEVGYAAIDMGHLGAELGHLVDFVNAFAGEVVEAIEVLVVGGHTEGVLALLDGEDGLEDGALAVLYPLAHGVEVGGKVNGGREDAFAILALALAIELFPPLGDIVELWLIVGKNFYLLASLMVEGVAGGCIDGCGVLVEGHGGGCGCLHVAGSLDEGGDIETGAGNGEESYRGEDGETAADVVGDNEGGVALFVGCGTCSALMCVGDGDDDAACLSEATLLLALFLEQTEGEGCLGGGAGLGDIDDAEAAGLEKVGELGEVVFANIVASEEDGGIGAIVGEPLEGVAEGLDDGFGAEVAAADASDDDGVAELT